MKKMIWLYVLLATFLLTSCGTLMQPYQMDSKMKDIELGMTKKKVISILGKDFESAGARMTSEGSIETISYKTASMTENTEAYYLLISKTENWLSGLRKNIRYTTTSTNCRKRQCTNKADASGHLPYLFYGYKPFSIHVPG